MLGGIKAKYRLNSCVGISLRQEGESVSFRCCKVSLDKEQLEIDETWEMGDWELLANNKHLTIPVALHLEARQILIKEGPAVNLDGGELKSIFPSYDPSRFYFTQIQGEAISWVAFVRKDYIEEILNRFSSAGYQIIKVFIGPFLLDPILGQLNHYNGDYNFDKHAIRIHEENKLWQQYRWGDEFESRFALKIGDHPIKQHYVTAYAAAFSALMADYVSDYALEIPAVEEQRQLWLEKQKFKLNLIAIVSLLFLLLLINTILFSHYYGENQALVGRVSSQQSTVKDLGNLENGIKENEQLLAQLGWNGGVSKAWLLDQIGYTIRQYAQITLSQIQINPQSKGSGNTVLQQADQIVIKGNSPTLEMLNLWLRELKNNPWIVHVSIEEYGNKQQDETLDAFTIKINYNDQVEGN
jgi:Tfp pilus assembly protein PilN